MQRYYRQNSNRILSACVSNNGLYAASGEQAETPAVHVFELKTLKVINVSYSLISLPDYAGNPQIGRASLEIFFRWQVSYFCLYHCACCCGYLWLEVGNYSSFFFFSLSNYRFVLDETYSLSRQPYREKRRRRVQDRTRQVESGKGRVCYFRHWWDAFL